MQGALGLNKEAHRFGTFLFQTPNGVSFSLCLFSWDFVLSLCFCHNFGFAYLYQSNLFSVKKKRLFSFLHLKTKISDQGYIT